ncbi:MAG: T9SS type A sorting domain-containing protein, partial [Ignavibacteria bacterium]|nr:T9SS type A sorting domain-containing protein [Ignavibacteria bacterium]
ITIENCIAFRNGVDTWHTGQVNGNGNGIKLGGNYIATPHIVKNCLAFDNAGNGGRGFDENNNLAGQTLYNCTAFRNLRSNYYFNNDPLSSGKHSIINCISYLEGTANIFKNSTLQTNSWQGFTVSTTDFLTVDTTGITNSRNSDGSLPHTNFMHLTDGSDFVDAGTNVGIPYYGSAPDLGFCESSFSSLPVELAAFTAAAQNENVVLNWQTATEVNNFGFEIERSPSQIPSQRERTFNSLFGGNEGGFIKIGFVKGNGSTTNAKDYSLTDKPKGGTEFQYRLKQIDFNGTFKYSNIVTAVTQGVNQFVLDQNYPNPFNPSTKITYQIPISSFVTLKVYDVLGNEVAVLVNEWQEAGNYSTLFTTSSAYSGKQLASGMSSKGGYASGVYFYTLSAGKFTDTKKFI